MAKVHEVKSWPEYFCPVFDGSKPFDVRRNDRGFEVGDRIYMREWDPTASAYTGRECVRRISYVLDGAGNVGTIQPLRGLSIGFAVLGLAIDPRRCAASVKTDPPQECDYPWCECDDATKAVMRVLDEEGLVIVPRNTLSRVLYDSPPSAADVDELRNAVK